jgi:hypothetical protein
MRAKRAVVLAAMVGFLAFAVTFSMWALPSSEPEAATPSQGGQPGLPSAPRLEEGAGAASRRDEGPSGGMVIVLWAGAAVASTGVVVSFLVFRVEVRKEKRLLRARRNRAAYYLDQRKYDAQMRGPPRNNT